MYPTGVAASGALAAVVAEAAEAEAAEVAEAAEAAEAAEDWRGEDVPARRAARAAEAKETEPPLALALGTAGLPFAIVAAWRASVALALVFGQLVIRSQLQRISASAVTGLQQPISQTL